MVVTAVVIGGIALGALARLLYRRLGTDSSYRSLERAYLNGDGYNNRMPPGGVGPI